MLLSAAVNCEKFAVPLPLPDVPPPTQCPADVQQTAELAAQRNNIQMQKLNATRRR